MKKIIYISLLLIAAACQKEEVFLYDQAKNSIQFNLKPEKMKLDYNFATQTYRGDVEMPWGEIVKGEKCYGDSLQRDTISLPLSILGLASENPHEFKLKAVPVKGQDSTKLAEVEFFPSYTFKAGQLADTIQIILLRPEERGEYTIGVTFDLDENSSLAMGAEEQSVYRLNISDRYKKPTEWYILEFCFGEFSEEKYAFMVSVLQIQFSMQTYSPGLVPKLIDALNAYNAANPDNPKDFTFPDM